MPRPLPEKRSLPSVFSSQTPTHPSVLDLDNTFSRKTFFCAALVHTPLLGSVESHDWRRQWHPTPVLLPGKSHGRRSLVGCSPWGRKESNMTERLHFHFFTFMHWRRKWQPTPVFLPGESQGQGSLVGCRLWGRTKSDTTEVT